MVDLEKYRLGEELGRGGVAVVYKGTHKILNKAVAVKVLHDQFTKDDDFIQRFINGARSAALLKHPNIIDVSDVGQEDGVYYIVMEYLEGETLEERIKRQGPYSEKEIESTIAPLAEALDYAHGKGVIHRDIKSANIFLANDGRVVLMDFDIAKAAEITVNLTIDGTMLGTPAYMSPEQAMGEKSSSKSDIYSLGVVIYEMATGELPFKGESPLSILRQITMDPPPRVCDTNPNISERLQKCILSCLEKKPEDRPGTAGEIFGLSKLGTMISKLGIDSDKVKKKESRKKRKEKQDKQVAGTAKKVRSAGRPRRRSVPFLKTVLILVFIGLLAVGPGMIRPEWNLATRLSSLFNRDRHYSGKIPRHETDPADLTDVQKERVRRLYDEALVDITGEQIENALGRLETITNMDPGNRLAHKGRQKIYDHHIKKAAGMLKKADLAWYIRYMDRAIAYFPVMKLDNLYQRGAEFSENMMLIGVGDKNAAAVYIRIIKEHPQEVHAKECLFDVIARAMSTGLSQGRQEMTCDLVLLISSELPALSPEIFILLGDAFYTSSVLLSGDKYNAASMYTRALNSDPEKGHAREQLRSILAEIGNRVIGAGSASEKRSLIRSARENFPSNTEFETALDSIQAEI